MSRISGPLPVCARQLRASPQYETFRQPPPPAPANHQSSTLVRLKTHHSTQCCRQLQQPQVAISRIECLSILLHHQSPIYLLAPSGSLNTCCPKKAISYLAQSSAKQREQTQDKNANQNPSIIQTLHKRSKTCPKKKSSPVLTPLHNRKRQPEENPHKNRQLKSQRTWRNGFSPHKTPEHARQLAPPIRFDLHFDCIKDDLPMRPHAHGHHRTRLAHAQLYSLPPSGQSFLMPDCSNGSGGLTYIESSVSRATRRSSSVDGGL